MIIMWLDRAIQQAEQHVGQGRKIVQRQRDLVASGSGGLAALELLETLERTQMIFEDDLERLLGERYRRKPVRKLWPI